MNGVFVVAAQRTPIGSFLGALADRTAPELGAHAIGAAVESAGVAPDAIDEVLMGCVVSAGVGQAPARQAMRIAGMPDAVGATTVNKVCGSGMKAAMLATYLIRAGSARRVVAGGMESMSNAPYLLAKARRGQRMGHGEVVDAMFLDGLEDAETGGSMGSFAQATADEHQISREDMDAFAIDSLTRALAAMEDGSLRGEIAALGEAVEDEQPRRARMDRIPSLRPAFAKDGTITAANASSISDGASALVLADEETAGSATPLARVVGHATHRRHREAAGPSRLAQGRGGSLRDQRSVRDGDHARHPGTGPRSRAGERARRRLRAGAPHRFHREPADGDARPRTAQPGRTAWRCGALHRRRRGHCRGPGARMTPPSAAVLARDEDAPG